MATLRALLRGAPPLGPRARLRLVHRWTGTPMVAVAAEVPLAGRIVDLGCGFGLFSALLAHESPAREVWGVDLDASKVARGQAWFGHLPNLRLQVGDLADVAVTPCDAVVIYDVLHHLRPALCDTLLREVWAALRPGGVLVVKENEVRPRWKHTVNQAVEIVAARSGLTLGDPVRLLPVADWARILTEAGFVVRRASPLTEWAGFYVPHALIVATRP